jgi:hypothetical protein
MCFCKRPAEKFLNTKVFTETGKKILYGIGNTRLRGGVAEVSIGLKAVKAFQIKKFYA